MSLVARVVLPVCVFVVFVVLTLGVRPGASPRSDRRLQALIGYLLVVSMIPGLTGRDLWPFAAWRFAAYDIADAGNFLTLVAVDGNGREQPVDSRAFEPLEGGGLVDENPRRTPPDVLRERLRFLLGMAQASLARAQSGRPVGTFSRFLGPFAAPIFEAGVEPWTDPSTRPASLRALRVYRVHWRVREGVATIERRELIADTRP